MNRILAGALGGLIATVPMTLVMSALHQKLPKSQQFELPPREITETILRRTGHAQKLTDSQLAGASLLAHFAYGAATGALYPLLSRRSHPVTEGGIYGLAVWGASYLGWIPAAKILRPGSKHPAERRRLMLCAHLVWGAVTASVARYLSAKD